MMRHFYTISLGLGALALATQHAFAQGAPSRNCAPRPVVIERLADRFGESRQAIGLGGQSQVVEVYANADSGSWTITVTLPTGLTCVMAAGQSFENLAEELAGGKPA